MRSIEIRKQFLEYFEKQGHTVVPSAPMVIKSDPTLMFTNAGMNQFKEYFLGNGTPRSTRLADSQKCLRVSGKHNDLEEVGVDTYHHTMFEMLGNWSFGDYFKKDAIKWAWELLTEVYKIDPEILYVTVFEGDNIDGTSRDQEAYDIWKQYIPEDRILDGNKADNFWEMGAQGPCGPCSEIHVDIRTEEEKIKVDGKSLVNADHPQVVEIWNLVFMQFNRLADGSLVNLPQTHVDTGMGFERLAMVLQGKSSNYDTDVFSEIIEQIAQISGSSYGENEKTDVAIRVIADHLRAVSFSIADGQLPSNTGAGYVIRMILRRAIRYGYTYLDLKEPFIFKLVDTLVRQMGVAFPELEKQQSIITNVIKEEEVSFLRTLATGLSLLDQQIAHLKENNLNTLDGAKAFELNDTFGFPKELTQLILSEQGLAMDEAGFQASLEQQKSISRAATSITTTDWIEVSSASSSQFVGYDLLNTDARIVKYRKVSTKKDGDHFQLILDQTPFYAEGGGQKGDTGALNFSSGETIQVIDTKKENGEIVHITKDLPDHPENALVATVDEARRKATSSNHTATHLLHEALRGVLGTHVEQKGSMVRNSSLRFDFSHFAKVTQEQLKQVEDFVNERIQNSLQLQEHRSMNYAAAIDAGAIALFGEKYEDDVRMIQFGNSKELCGGTHVSNTADIWQFKITQETAVAAGIRRIEAITGTAVKEYYKKQERSLIDIQNLLDAGSKSPQQAITDLLSENKKLTAQLEKFKGEKTGALKAKLIAKVQDINGINFLATEVDLDPKEIKNLCFELDREIDRLYAVIGAKTKDKATLTVIIDKELAQENNLNAGNIVRVLGKNINGGGGGQPHYATAGGKNPDGLEAALDQAIDYIRD
ncbi:MAG: alanine--tRNA ligase [Nonlabens sp.]